MEMTDEYYKSELKKEVNYLVTVRKELNNEIAALKQDLEYNRREVNQTISDEAEAARTELKKALGDAQSFEEIKSAHTHTKKLKSRIKNMNDELQSKVNEQNQQIANVNNALDTYQAMTKSYFMPTETQTKFYMSERQQFLELYMEHGTIIKACRYLPNVKPYTINYYRQKDKQFDADMKTAYAIFKERIDAEILDRALNGQMEALTYKGEVCDTVRRFDNRLLEKAAAAHNPEKYDRAKLDRIEDADKPTLNLNILSFNSGGEEQSATEILQDALGVVHGVTDTGDIARNKLEKETIIDVETDTPTAPDDEKEA